MAKTTLIFGLLLVILGVVSYVGTGSQHPTALIPMWFGVGLGVFGFLAISPSERRRKIFMHVNVTIGALGFIGAVASALHNYGAARSAGVTPDYTALEAQGAMAVILLVYVNLCVRSFIAARRARQA